MLNISNSTSNGSGKHYRNSARKACTKYGCTTNNSKNNNNNNDDELSVHNKSNAHVKQVTLSPRALTDLLMSFNACLTALLFTSSVACCACSLTMLVCMCTMCVLSHGRRLLIFIWWMRWKGSFIMTAVSGYVHLNKKPKHNFRQARHSVLLLFCSHPSTIPLHCPAFIPTVTSRSFYFKCMAAYERCVPVPGGHISQSIFTWLTSCRFRA